MPSHDNSGVGVGVGGRGFMLVVLTVITGENFEKRKIKNRLSFFRRSAVLNTQEQSRGSETVCVVSHLKPSRRC
jgi:hypothetical protein